MSYKGMTFYFMRHGETYLNHYMRMQGWSNAPLTEEGTKEVHRSGKGLADVNFDAVYTSDLTRTIDTANIVLAENHNGKQLVIEAKPELREVFFGSFEGMPVADVEEIVAQSQGYDSVEKYYEETTLPERMNAYREADEYGHAEDFMTFWARIEKGLIDIVNRHKDTDDTVLVVVHGLVIRYMMMSLVADLDEDIDFLTNASITRVQYRKGKFIVDSYNDTSHFAPPLVEPVEDE